MLKTKIEGGVVVAVSDPVVAGEEAPLLLPPLVLGRLHPARFPEVDVEMDDGKARFYRAPRERAFARSGQARDQDACLVRQRSRVG